MGFKDWMRKGQESAKQSVAQNAQEQRPQTAREMYNRLGAREKASRVAPTADQEARARKIGEEMREMHPGSGGAAPAQTDATGSGGSPQAQRQKQEGQDVGQAALSPTDGSAGKTAGQEKHTTEETRPKREKPVVQRPKTFPRRRPSWER